MKQEIRFDKNGIVIRRTVDLPIAGEQIVESRITYGDLEKRGEVDLRVKRIAPEYENGTLKAITLELSHFKEVDQGTISERTLISGTSELQKKAYIKLQEGLQRGKFYAYYQTYVDQCFKDGTMPNLIWKIIKEASEIQYSELEAKLLDMGYKKSGSIGASVVILREVLEVIEEKGRGKTRKLRYTGP